MAAAVVDTRRRAACCNHTHVSKFRRASANLLATCAGLADRRPGPKTGRWRTGSATAATALRAPPVGTAYGALLNHRAALAALGDAVHAAPYKAPPKAPVLYIKPRNTFAGHGDTVVGARRRRRTGNRRHAGHRHRPRGLPRRRGRRAGLRGRLHRVQRRQRAPRLVLPPVAALQVPRRLPADGPWVIAARHVAEPDALDVRVHLDGRAGAADLHRRHAAAGGAADRRRQRLHDAGRRRPADAGRGGRRAARPRRAARAHRDRRHRRAREPAGGGRRGHEARAHCLGWRRALGGGQRRRASSHRRHRAGRGAGGLAATGAARRDHCARHQLCRPQEGTGQGIDAECQGRAVGLSEGAERAARPPRRHAAARRCHLHAL